MAQPPCPLREEYERLETGSVLSPLDVERLTSHLESCEHCAAFVETLGGEDTDLSLLRDVPPRPAVSSAATAGLIADLCRLPLMTEATSTENGTIENGPATEALDLLAPPQGTGEIGRLGGYRVLRVLGAGGMGVVFEAEDMQLKRRVALKGIRPTLAASAGAKGRFLREARAIAALKHEHVVTVYQVGEDRGVPYLAMEYLEGESLSRRLDRDGKLETAEVLRIGSEIAEGLAAAHDKGLVHRDVKPANIWLEAKEDRTKAETGHGPTSRLTDSSSRRHPSFRVKILDFGLARGGETDTHITAQGAIVGTPAYMSPEQTRGEEHDFHADLFSLGCVLYRMCTGQAPFQGKDSMSTLLAVATHQPSAPRHVNAQVPAALSALIMRLLNKDPAKRPGSAREVADTLQQIAPAPSSVAAARRPRWLIPAAAAILLAVLPLSYFFGATVIRFATNKGEVIIETDDPDIVVTIMQGKAEIHDKVKDRHFVLEAGEYELKVTEKDGVRVATKEFKLTRGGKVIVNARLELAQARLKGDGKVKIAGGDPDRRAAEWVLSVGGQVRVQKQERFLVKIDDLPEVPFALTGVGLGQRPIADADLAHLGGLHTLELLDLRDTRIRDAGLEHFKDMTALRDLRLANTQVTEPGVKKLAAALPQCRILWDGGAIEPKKVVAKAEASPKVADPDRRAAEWALACGGNVVVRTVTGAHPKIAAAKDLPKDPFALVRVLLVGGGDRVTDQGLDNLEGLRHLTHLYLHKTAITDAGLDRVGQLTTLVDLFLPNTRITDAGLAKLTGLSALTQLSVYRTKVTDAGLADIAALRELEVVDLNDQPITDAGIAVVVKLPKLKSLGLAGTKITDRGLALVAAMPHVITIDVGYTAVTDAGMEHLTKMTQLERLNISRSQVTEAGLTNLKGLPALWELGLSERQATDGGLDLLRSFPKLATLKMVAQLNEAHLEHLRALPSLTELHIQLPGIFPVLEEKLRKALPKCKVTVVR